MKQDLYNLSNREKEVLFLITKGYTNIKIAKKLTISKDTVKTHVKSLLNKLNVNNRLQAAVKAIKEGMAN